LLWLQTLRPYDAARLAHILGSADGLPAPFRAIVRAKRWTVGSIPGFAKNRALPATTPHALREGCAVLAQHHPRFARARLALTARFRAAVPITLLRRSAGLSQEELAAKSGYARSYVSFLECGHKDAAVTTIAVIATACGFDVEIRVLRNGVALASPAPLLLRSAGPRRFRHRVTAWTALAVHAMRVSGGLRNGQLARRLRIHRWCLGRLERGRGTTSFETLHKIAAATGHTVQVRFLGSRHTRLLSPTPIVVGRPFGMKRQ